MRYLTFKFDRRVCWGRVDGDRVVPLDHVYPSLRSAIVADALGSTAVAAGGGEPIALTDVTFLPPVPDPSKILCIGLNYEMHRRETGRATVESPTVFTRFSDSQTAHRAPIVRPGESVKLDFEGELAIVIGAGGRRISPAKALHHVAGYSCYNDGSVRDWQAHTIQFTPGKNFPHTGSFGPWLVTPEEFGTPGPQKIQTRLNGVVMQEAIIADMIFPITRLIAYCSTFTPLSPGDVIVTGTPGGVGVKRDPPLFMMPGDVVEVEIGNIGILRNHIVDERVV